MKYLVSREHCMAIAKMRRELMRYPKSNVLFLDETALRLNAVRHRTLIAPGERNYVAVEDTSAYSARYDMIACCSGDRVLPPIIFTPEDRKCMRVEGIRKEMILSYIDKILAQAVGSLDRFPVILVIDASTSHNPSEMLQAFHDAGCQDMQTIYTMPTNSAKRLSPLDNSIFRQWKEMCRKRNKIKKKNIVQIMSDCWNNIPQSSIINHYRHCGLMHGIDPYYDCPNPSSHHHHTH